MIGLIFIGIAIVIVLIVVGNYYLTRASKGYAALEGTASAINVFKTAFNN